MQPCSLIGASSQIMLLNTFKQQIGQFKKFLSIATKLHGASAGLSPPTPTAGTNWDATATGEVWLHVRDCCKK